MYGQTYTRDRDRVEKEKKNTEYINAEALTASVLSYFFRSYEDYTGHPHPSIHPDKLQEILSTLTEYDADQDFVDAYFGDEYHRGLCGDSDCSIFHFASPGVLQKITRCNLTLQTLDGILCHCGEKVCDQYTPHTLRTFAAFAPMVEKCYQEERFIRTLRPSTLEGCVVRISDMIAYLGKDRQDAYKAKLRIQYDENPLGARNPDIITTIVQDLIENSLEKPYLALSQDVYEGMSAMLRENNEKIYQCEEVVKPYYEAIKPMMALLYERFLKDLQTGQYNSLIFQHYLNGSVVGDFYRHPQKRFVQMDIHDPNDIVADFLASMTDDYFIDAFAYLFPSHKLNQKIHYIGYFDPRFTK